MARKSGDSGQATVLDGGQIKRLIRIAGTTQHSERDVTVITLSYWLGLRAKELASLKLSDVYLPDGEVKQVLHLKASYTKRAKVRDVYLSSDVVMKRLKEYWEFCLSSRQLVVGQRLHMGALTGRRAVALASSAKASSDACHTEILGKPLFRTRSGKAFTANGMVHLLRHLHSLAGIDGGSSHSGRRTMITRLAETGVDLKSIATLAGHSSIRTTAGLSLTSVANKVYVRYRYHAICPV